VHGQTGTDIKLSDASMFLHQVAQLSTCIKLANNVISVTDFFSCYSCS